MTLFAGKHVGESI